MYINLETKQYPITEQDIRLANPNTSYPTPFPVPDGHAWVFATPQPTINPITQLVREIDPELTDKGHYEQRWTVVSKFTEYVDENGVTHSVADQESVALAAARELKIKQNKAQLIQQTQQHLDSFAQTRGYDNILSLCTYATSTVIQFQAEGQTGVRLRDATWSKLYEILATIESGIRLIPGSFDEIKAELPELVWTSNNN